jgi:hypothetical protein
MSFPKLISVSLNFQGFEIDKIGVIDDYGLYRNPCSVSLFGMSGDNVQNLLGNIEFGGKRSS